jgi:hypothetical protein
MQTSTTSAKKSFDQCFPKIIYGMVRQNSAFGPREFFRTLSMLKKIAQSVILLVQYRLKWSSTTFPRNEIGFEPLL